MIIFCWRTSWSYSLVGNSTFLPGRCVAPPASSSPLLLSHPRPLSLAPLPHVDRTPQRCLVLLAVDAFHFHGDAPRAGCRAPRPVGVPVRQHGAAPLLAVRQHHGHAPSPVLSAHVPDGNQRCDLHQTRGGHRRLDVCQRRRLGTGTVFAVWNNLYLKLLENICGTWELRRLKGDAERGI